jgi:hypothetical protein
MRTTPELIKEIREDQRRERESSRKKALRNVVTRMDTLRAEEEAYKADTAEKIAGMEVEIQEITDHEWQPEGDVARLQPEEK